MSQSNEAPSMAGDLLKEVSEVLKGAHTTVRARYKDQLVERGIASRVETLDKGFTKLQNDEKELRKIKPDQVNISADGVKTESFSKEAWDKKQKAEEALTKLRSALDKALNGEGYDKLQEQLNK